MLPFVIERATADPALTEFLTTRRAAVREVLTHHGAVLLRSFDVEGTGEFERVVRALSGAPLDYTERSSPRTRLSGNVYTSTDYPPAEEIFLHNENSYQARWPRTLYFHCAEPPETGGATPLADIRRVHDAIDSRVRAEFARRRWMVVRNFHPGFGTRWDTAFGTADRDAVDEYCERNGLTTEWLDGGGLRTRAVRDAIHRHPVTGAPVWFNHVAFFHNTTQPEDVRDGLLELFDEANLPTNTYFGDGGRIPDEVVEHLRSCYRAARVRFDYHRGDVLVVDNMRAAHGREPFTGPRRVAVAMAEPSTADPSGD
ncbi:TauD/TfdA family dioxygenase [Amycolatopsis samaneae]|uniref:TauD/TfdA family dioxygenase n=1 Tax=Amycolatopsis samaneae TaxID=664691 RepID=A0ABW5GP11_9PSEU